VLKQIIEIILKKRGFFTMEHIIEESGWPREEVWPRMYKLEKEGLIKRVRNVKILLPSGEIVPQILYTSCVGLKQRLSLMELPRKKNTGWDKIWKTIRAMRRFTRADLVQLTGTSDGQVKDFTKVLERAGYIRKAACSPGKSAIFVLCKDPGPQRPRIKLLEA